MPSLIKQIAQYLPFQLFRYFPVQLILGKLPPATIAADFALGAVWLIVALVLFDRAWRAGVKRFSAVGA